MTLADHHLAILVLHVGCVGLSGGLFAVRGVLRVRNSALANHALARTASHVVDTALILAAVLLTRILRQYPFVDGWLTAKVLWLAAYIALGTVALKRARTTAGRAAAFAAALAVYGFIVGIAVAHRPAGWLALIHRGT